MGDIFYIHILDETLAYQVDQIRTVKPDELDLLRVVEGRDLVTLLTCTPYAVNTHRLLVRGTRIPYEEAEEIQEEDGDAGTISAWLREYLLSIIAGVVLLIILIVVLKLRRKRRKPGRRRR